MASSLQRRRLHQVGAVGLHPGGHLPAGRPGVQQGPRGEGSRVRPGPQACCAPPHHHHAMHPSRLPLPAALPAPTPAWAATEHRAHCACCPPAPSPEPAPPCLPRVPPQDFCRVLSELHDRAPVHSEAEASRFRRPAHQQHTCVCQAQQPPPMKQASPATLALLCHIPAPGPTSPADPNHHPPHSLPRRRVASWSAPWAPPWSACSCRSSRAPWPLAPSPRCTARACWWLGSRGRWRSR